MCADFVNRNCSPKKSRKRAPASRKLLSRRRNLLKLVKTSSRWASAPVIMYSTLPAWANMLGEQEAESKESKGGGCTDGGPAVRDSEPVDSLGLTEEAPADAGIAPAVSAAPFMSELTSCACDSISQKVLVHHLNLRRTKRQLQLLQEMTLL